MNPPILSITAEGGAEPPAAKSASCCIAHPTLQWSTITFHFKPENLKEPTLAHTNATLEEPTTLSSLTIITKMAAIAHRLKLYYNCTNHTTDTTLDINEAENVHCRYATEHMLNTSVVIGGEGRIQTCSHGQSAALRRCWVHLKQEAVGEAIRVTLCWKAPNALGISRGWCFRKQHQLFKWQITMESGMHCFPKKNKKKKQSFPLSYQ